PKAVGLLWLMEMLMTETEPTEAGDADAFQFWSLDTISDVLDGKTTVPDAHAYADIDPSDPRVSFYRPTADFQGRVLGEFPSVPDTQVIPSGWLRNLPHIPDAMLAGIMPEVGCDVARHGSDRTCIVTDRGGAALDLQI